MCVCLQVLVSVLVVCGVLGEGEGEGLGRRWAADMRVEYVGKS